MRERLDDMHARFDHLERDMRMIAETIALHARYHLAVMPPVPEFRRQREAVILGDERFKVLAEQVDRRVREGRPLMQETIDRLNSAQQEEWDQATGERPTHNSTPAHKVSSAASERLNLEQTPPASAKAGRRSPGFSQHAKVAADRTEPTLDPGPNPPAMQNADPESSNSMLEALREKSPSKWPLILSVFLPFAAGYYLAYLFRTINAAVHPRHWPPILASMPPRPGCSRQFTF